MPGRSLPLFGSDSFRSDLSEAGLPRMTSTALRWTPKRHHFTRTNTRHTNKTPQTAQRYAVDPSFLVCLTPFPIKKTLKMALQFVFGRCKHPFAGKQMARNAIILTLMRSSRTPEICSSAFHCSSRRIRRLHNGVPSPSIGNTPQIASPYQGQPLQSP